MLLPCFHRAQAHHAFAVAQIKENKDKIKLNNQLPYLVGNVVEVLDVQPEDDEEEDGAAVRAAGPRM